MRLLVANQGTVSLSIAVLPRHDAASGVDASPLTTLAANRPQQAGALAQADLVRELRRIPSSGP